MFNRTCCLMLTSMLLIGASVSAQKPLSVDTISIPGGFAKKSVLIAKGQSYLENTVAQIVTDSLKVRGITIVTADLQSLQKMSSIQHNAILVFGAVKSSKLIGPVSKYIASLRDTKNQAAANVLICTVYGDIWSPKKASVDAVTGPTQTLNPLSIAQKLIIQIDTVFGRIAQPTGN